MFDRKDLPIREKTEILKSNKTETVINIKEAEKMSNAWKYAVQMHC